MDPSLTAPASSVEVEDEWDADGFVIPSLNVGNSELGKSDVPEVDNTKPSPKIVNEEQIYLGPHGRPRSQGKQQDLRPSGQKPHFRNKVKDVNRKYSGPVRQNKV